MSSTDLLLDLIPTGREVPVGKAKVKIFPVPLSFIGKMLVRFPELRAAINSGEAGWAQVLLAVPDAIPIFIAAGLGEPENKLIEERAGRIAPLDQLDLITEIIAETKGGDDIGPFRERIRRLALTLGFPPAAVESLMRTWQQQASSDEAAAEAAEQKDAA